MKQRMTPVVLAAVLAGSTLSACAPLVVGGMVGTALVVSDRRTAGTVLEDETNELRGKGVMSDNFGDRAHVSDNRFNRQVLLTGEVPSDKERQQAAQLAQRLENVKTVLNELVVAAPSSLTERSKDALVTGKVKATLVDSKDLFANAFKVVTERGTVYLMGRVTQREAASATDLVRTIGGVNRVVRAFELITEEELRALSNTK